MAQQALMEQFMNLNQTKSGENAATPKEKSRLSPAAIIGLVLIAALAVVGFMEARAWLGYSRTLSSLQQASDEAARKSGGGKLLLLSDARGMISGSSVESDPRSQGGVQVLTYRWKGLFSSYAITLRCTTGDEAAVLAVEDGAVPAGTGSMQSADAIAGQEAGSGARKKQSGRAQKKQQEQPAKSGRGDRQADSAPRPGPAAKPKRGPLADAAPFIMGGMDANGDGKISPQEAPEKIRPYFSRLDTSGDGFLDFNEIVAAPALDDLKDGQEPPQDIKPE